MQWGVVEATNQEESLVMWFEASKSMILGRVKEEEKAQPILLVMVEEQETWEAMAVGGESDEPSWS